MKRRLMWLLRGPSWRRWHLHLCQKCARRFGDNEPGSVPLSEERFPLLCRCKDPHIGGHVNCRRTWPLLPTVHRQDH